MNYPCELIPYPSFLTPQSYKEIIWKILSVFLTFALQFSYCSYIKVAFGRISLVNTG